MRRRTFDFLASSVGLLLAILLIVAGALLFWAYSFVNSQVTNQLSEQKITFPATSSPAFTSLPADDQAAMKPYAGQLMTTGAQALAGRPDRLDRRDPRLGRGRDNARPRRVRLLAPAPHSRGERTGGHGVAAMT
jgi:hypothetical protein